MRNLFKTGKVKEIILFVDGGKDVKITMLESGCFEIRQFDPNVNYWALCFETSSKCGFQKSFNLAQSLIQ